MRIVENKRPKKVRVGDEIVGYGTATAVLPGPQGPGRRGIYKNRMIPGPFFATDTGYNCLHFPADFDVPVVSKRLWVSP